MGIPTEVLKIKTGDFADIPIAGQISSKTVRLRGKGLCWQRSVLGTLCFSRVALYAEHKTAPDCPSGLFQPVSHMKHNIQHI